MLGAERLVYGTLGDVAVHRPARRDRGASEGRRHRQHRRRAPTHLHWFDAATRQRRRERRQPSCALALSALGRAPRRRQAGAREHARRVSPRRRATAIAPSNATSSSSADGVPFLLHDATLQRTTNGHGRAGDLAWSELSRLDAGTWHSRAYAGEPPATLDGVAAFCLAQRLRAQHRDQADARARGRDRAGGRRAGGAPLAPAPRCRRCSARSSRPRSPRAQAAAPDLPRAPAARQPARRLARRSAGARLRRRRHRSTR